MPPAYKLSQILDRLSPDIWMASEDEIHSYNFMRDRCFTMLVQCRNKGICLCGFDDLFVDLEDLHDYVEHLLSEHGQQKGNHYDSWSPDNLEALVVHRKIPLHVDPEKFELEKLLRQSDSRHPFRLMDLPLELRRMIFTEALYTGREEEFEVTKIRPEHMALLQTSHQIREEATPIFYSRSRFHFSVSGTRTVSGVSIDHHAWLEHISAEKINMLRHVSFYVHSIRSKCNLRINLDSRSGCSWTITTTSKPACPCPGQKVRSLAEVREYFSNKTTNEAAVKAIEDSIAIANDAAQNFHALCGAGTGVKPTMDGLQILSVAARPILELSRKWNKRVGDDDPYPALDDEAEEDENED